jgi:hypothetical protein
MAARQDGYHAKYSTLGGFGPWRAGHAIEAGFHRAIPRSAEPGDEFIALGPIALTISTGLAPLLNTYRNGISGRVCRTHLWRANTLAIACASRVQRGHLA